MYLELLFDFLGVFCGAFIAYLFAVKLESNKKNSRLYVVKPILLQDLENNLRDLELVELFSNNCRRIQEKTSQNEAEEQKRQSQIEYLQDRIRRRLRFKTQFFIALLNDILLLESDLAHRITANYRHVDKLKSDLLLAFNEGNWETKMEETKGKREKIIKDIKDITVSLEE